MLVEIDVLIEREVERFAALEMAVGAVVATSLAVEGDFQLYYSLFRSNKPRWHVFEANSDKIDFVYVDKVVIPVPKAIYNILPTSMLQLIRE